MVYASGGSESIKCVPINIWFGSNIWDEGWMFGIWFNGGTVGGIGSGCCVVDMKNGGIWGIEDCVAVDWKVSGVWSGVAKGTIT